MSKTVEAERLEQGAVNLPPAHWRFLEEHIGKLSKDRKGDPWSLQELFRHIVSEYIEQEKSQ